MMKTLGYVTLIACVAFGVYISSRQSGAERYALISKTFAACDESLEVARRADGDSNSSMDRNEYMNECMGKASFRHKKFLACPNDTSMANCYE